MRPFTGCLKELKRHRALNGEHEFIRMIYRGSTLTVSDVLKNDAATIRASIVSFFRTEASDGSSHDADGHPQRLVGANIDVTERRQTEALAKESQSRLAAALAAGRVMAFEWDATTRETHRSDNAAAILGDDHAGVCDGPCEDFLSRVHSEDQTRFRKCLRELSPKNASYALSFRYVRPAGQQVWLEETGRGDFDSMGRLQRVRGLTRDISERKKAELALAEHTLQLEQAGKAALVGSFAYDLDTDTLQTSQGYAAIHGFPDGTTEVQRSQWRAGVHPEDRARLVELRRQAFRDHLREYGVEYRIVRPSGEIRWIEGRCFFAYRSDGRPQRAVGVDIDVTKHKRAEEHQRALRAELDHRVKNVLATVSAVAAHTMDASSSMAQFVAALDGRIRSMASTHELLSDRRWEGVPLQSLLWRELEPYASKSNTDLNGPEVLLRADAGQTVASVLHELATNAAKHGALSTREGRVAVEWSRRRNGRAPGCLTINWREFGGPRVKTPKRSGYGTNIITELVPYELGGAVDLAYPQEGVKCRLDIPGKWLRSSRQNHA
jgi:PAS domain S-box-containing protein